VGVIATRELLKKWSQSFRDEGLKIVTTNGCFDVLHVGHIRFIQQCAEQGDVLIVGINSDESVKRLKGETRPIFSQDDRAEMLSAIEGVNVVSVFDEDDLPIEFIKAVKPDIHVKGGDYTPETMPETPVVEEGGGKVVILPYTDGFSTSKVMERIYKAWKP
jgi:glycerol-3-phosphate cytidylyltransferase